MVLLILPRLDSVNFYNSLITEGFLDFPIVEVLQVASFVKNHSLGVVERPMRLEFNWNALIVGQLEGFLLEEHVRLLLILNFDKIVVSLRQARYVLIFAKKTLEA